MLAVSLSLLDTNKGAFSQRLPCWDWPKAYHFNVYLFLRQRETEHERGRGRERGRHRIGNRLQAPSHQPRARRGLKLTDREIVTWAEVGRLTDWATQAPLAYHFRMKLTLRRDLLRDGGAGITTQHRECDISSGLLIVWDNVSFVFI